MPQWELNDPDYADGWQQRPERQQRDRRQYSTFQTFSGRFVTWPEDDPDPDFLIHFIPQDHGLIMALVLPISKCQ